MDEEGGNSRQSLSRREYWKFASAQILRAAERRDQLIVGGAAGTLLLSITFLHDIAPQPSAWSLVLLVVTWFSLLIGLGVSLLSMRSTEKAFRASLDDAGKHEGRSEEDWNKTTRCQNTAASWLLLVGIALFAVFAVVNLPWSRHAQDPRTPGKEGTAAVEASPRATEGTRTGEEGGRNDSAPAGPPTERTGTGQS